MTENTKPLSKYYRQPSIYIKFPSGGTLYGPEIVKPSTTGEHAVLPMTAMDDLAFKTPDALMSGQATVNVIKSCIPDILDPWKLVNYDVDAVLIAIRIASYGETMDLTMTVPVINEQVTQSINLNQLLESVSNIKLVDTITLTDGLKVKVKPLVYKQIVDSQLKTFQQQRIYLQVQSSKEMSDDDKTKRFTESFKMLTSLNRSLLLTNMESIGLPSGEIVTNQDEIKDFFDNAEAKIVKEIEDKLVPIRQQGAVKPLKIKATDEQVKKGVPVTYEVPLTFDNANFFG